MPETYAVTPCQGPLNASIRPPGSKSITNRALVCAALADGQSRLSGALASDDTRVMIAALNKLGIEIDEADAGRTLSVSGAGGRIPALEAEIFVGNSGTTVRFLTAMLTLGTGGFRLDGVERMRQRPIGDLVDALGALGANVICEADNRCPPLWVHASGLPGGTASVAGNISSQFLSGLLMAAPCAQNEVELKINGELVSKPYVRMTAEVINSFGGTVRYDQQMREFAVPPTGYQACDYAIEPDASAASYFWAAAAIVGGTVTVEGLSANALQGDVAFVDCLDQMGCKVERGTDAIKVTGGDLHGIDVDMNAISDTVQTLAAAALFAEGPTQITGVAHNRHKETDRIGDLATELRKLGAEVEELEDGLRITPPAKLTTEPVSIETYDDHRMAMSLALVGLKRPNVLIENPQCTAKTYPNFFKDLESVCRTDVP